MIFPASTIVNQHHRMMTCPGLTGVHGSRGIYPSNPPITSLGNVEWLTQPPSATG